jgi:hypothetical protein
MPRVVSERTLTTRELNRAVLARQHLLERIDRPLTAVIDDMAGIQTQYAPSAYIGLWSRISNFERASLTSAKESREVITGTLMRSTIHTVTRPDYWPTVAAIRNSRQQWLKRVTASEYSELDLHRAADALRDVFRNGPMPAREVTTAMVARGFPRQAVGWAGLWVDIVRIPPSSTWERRANDLYELADRWLPRESVPGGVPSEHDAVQLLLTRYLGGFGPARVNDFANWAGIALPLAKRAAARLDLRHFRDEDGRDLVDIPDAPLPSGDAPAPVRFLPVWDATLLVHCRRTLILREVHRPLVFNTRTPHSVNTFLVDGHVAGTWRYESGKVATLPFDLLPRDVQHDVDAEAERLAAFMS